MTVSFRLNGRPVAWECRTDQSLLELLKGRGVASLHAGCDGEGSCGLCALIMNRKLVNSCLIPAALAEGAEIITVEGISKDRRLSVVQRALVEVGAVQCGYCMPATVLAIHELLERRPDPSDEEAKEALAGIICRCTGYKQQLEAVKLASLRLKQPDYMRPPTAAFRPELRHVGKDSQKVDAAGLVRGEKAFVEDRLEPEACVLKLLGSPYAHARIKSIDVSAAESMPGVVAVVSYLNCPDRLYTSAGQGFPEPSPYDRRMFSRKLLHVGDRVAAVLAESEAEARSALAAIKVEYETLEPVLSIERAAEPGAPVIHEDPIRYQFPIGADQSRNLAASAQGSIGQVDRALAAAQVVIEREYETSRVQCTPLEPHLVYAKMEAGRLVIHASTQVPWHVRRIVAGVVGLPENKVRVIKERVGGGFGAKQDIVVEDLAGWLAWTYGRPVYWRMTREEEFVASRTRHPMKIKVTLGASRDGLLEAIDFRLRADTGAYGNHALTVPMNACSKSLPLLRCGNVRFSVESYYTNLPVSGAYQGYGAPQGSFALQTALAELACELGLDPLELIEKNRVREGTVIEILKSLGEGREGAPVTVGACAISEMISRGRRALEWGRPVESDDPDIRIGKAAVIVQQGSGLPGLDSANATMRLLTDGSFLLLSGGADLGTGLDTVTAKLAAETLQVDLAAVTVISGDTDATPFDKGAYASSGTYFSGNAALAAARNLGKRMLSAAAGILGEAETGLRLEYPGLIRGKTGTLSYAELAARSAGGSELGELSASGAFATEHAAFPYGAHFCQLRVNVRTGDIRVERYLAYQDPGTPINPELALGQIYGAVLKALGHSLYEEQRFDQDGRCLNPGFLDYKVPSVFELPDDLRAELVPVEDELGPFGAKSVSEVSVNGAACALAIAIHDATGVWLRRWPFSPESLLKALGKI